MLFDLHVAGVVEAGHGHASGVRSTKYPEGTINLQRDHFLSRGLDIRHCFAGTINLSVAPRRFRVKRPEFVLEQIVWKQGRRPENFFIGRCRIDGGEGSVDGFIYHPDPRTKDSSIDNPCHFQLLAPFISGISYGTTLAIQLRSAEFEILGDTAE